MDEAMLQQLLDKDAIRDCIHRYCRGIDRADEAALASAYWPDAHDNHGAFRGSIPQFLEWVRKAWARGPRNIHNVGNILIEFRGRDRAAVETYFLALQRGIGPDGVERQVLLAGRYCDLFERRGDEWRVRDRTVVYDWVEPQSPPEGDEPARFGPRTPIGTSFPDDPVYRIGGEAGRGRDDDP